MIRVRDFFSRSLMIFLPVLCLGAEGIAVSAWAQAPSPSPATSQRRPLPKPPNGARGFEKYAANDSSSRLIAGGATRATVNPRQPVAPLEGRAYDERPFFAWEIAPGSKSYHVAVYEGDLDAAPASRLVYETDVATTEVLYPADAPHLKAGTLYSWRVSTTNARGQEDGNVARFIILAGPEAAEVKEALKTAGLSSPKSAADRLDQARVFENYCVWYDALRIASELAENPSNKEAQAYYEALLFKLDSKPDQ
jgi:hypothetical protein